MLQFNKRGMTANILPATPPNFNIHITDKAHIIEWWSTEQMAPLQWSVSYRWWIPPKYITSRFWWLSLRDRPICYKRHEWRLTHRNRRELVAKCLKQGQQNKLDESDLGGRLRHLLPVHKGSHGQPFQLLHVTLQHNSLMTTRSQQTGSVDLPNNATNNPVSVIVKSCYDVYRHKIMQQITR